MADSLPWFKFDAAKWITGDITLEDLEVQGVFINICSQYWFKGGKLSLSEIKRRLSAAKPTAFEALIERGIIAVSGPSGDEISISFLDEQIHERKSIAAQNSLNGARGGRPKSENKPTALIPLSETKAKKSREEEKREEQNRTEQTREESALDFEKEIFGDEIFIGELNRMFPAVDLKKAWGACRLHFEQQPRPPSATWMWRQKLQTWAENDQRKIDEQRAKTKGNAGQSPSAGNGQPRKPWKWE